MTSSLPPPTDVLGLVFATWAAGTAAGGALTTPDGRIAAGHFKVVWFVVALVSAAAGFAYAPAWILTAVAIVAYVSRRRGPGRAAAALAGAAAIALVIAVAIDGLDGGLGLVGWSLASAALLGAVTNAMLLGHWHLNQPRLGTAPIRRLVWSLWATLVVFVAAAVAVGLSADGVAGPAAWTAVAFAAFTAVLTAMVSHLVRTRSIMSATGILYLEVLLCVVAAFTGSLAALSN